MNKNIVIALIMLISQLTFSQVGIGTTNPSASSALEIRSANSGLLIPRVSLNSTTDATTIASPATSLLVYNLSSSNDVTPGFYYWEGSWKPLKATGGSSSGWSLTGNNTAATDYLGTNNYNSLVFKVNNNTFSKFHPNGGITIGNSSNANDNNSIAIGTSATSNTSTEAIAIGVSANASGYQSVSLGKQSLSSNNNTLALGYFSTASGQQATAIGANASASGQNATAIGYQATASQANSVILGKVVSGDEWSNPKIGIGTSTPDERLHIVGSVKIVDGTQGAGKVLTSDANGKATWASSSSNTKSYGDIYYNGSGQSLNQYAAVSFGSTNSFSNIAANTDNF
jgi:trimeric autotransporter adhesin